MTNTLEQRLRRAVLLLMAVLALQLLYHGARLLLWSAPQPLPPAADSLQVAPVGYRTDASAAVAPDLVARPLFWPGRQAHVAPVVAQPQEAPAPAEEPAPLENIRLLGVYAARGNSGIIVVHKGERRRLQIDDTVDGWRFALVSADGAVFENGEQSHILRLEHAMPAAQGEERGAAARRGAAQRGAAQRSAAQRSARRGAEGAGDD